LLEGVSENGKAPPPASSVSPLIKKAVVTADDESAEVIVNIAKAYIQFSTGIPSVPASFRHFSLLSACSGPRAGNPFRVQ